MLSEGNSDVQVCVNNLLKTWKKEAPYGRNKGISTSFVNKPFSTATDQMISDAEDMVEEYEDRADVNEITAEMDDKTGDITLTADISINTNEDLDDEEEEEDE
ncbi:MAG: early E1A protein [Butyrivibrio sp.]|nr:early E1A protein [Butyrivibrio sp.]